MEKDVSSLYLKPVALQPRRWLGLCARLLISRQEHGHIAYPDSVAYRAAVRNAGQRDLVIKTPLNIRAKQALEAWVVWGEVWSNSK